MKYNKIKLKILLPVSAVITFLLAVLVYGIYHVQNKNDEENIIEHTDKVNQLFKKSLSAESKVLASHINYLLEDPVLLKSYKTRDKKNLYNHCLPIFDEMKMDYRITHFYFIDTSKTCFLRVHNEARKGDVINRFTLEKSKQSHEPAYGIELGTFGTFTLRYVSPIIENNNICGYLELGMEIEHLAPYIKEIVGVDLFFLINKKKINQKKWKEGLSMMDKQGAWDEVSDFVIIDKSIESGFDIEKIINSQNDHETVSVNDKVYEVRLIPLCDISGDNVGKIIVIGDVSKQQAAIRSLLFFLIFISVVIGILLIVFFYKYIATIEKELVYSYNKIEEDKNEIRLKNEENAALYEEYKSTNEQLFISKEKSEESNRLKSAFLANMSHEIRTPLNSVIGFSQLLKRPNIEEEKRNSFLAKIQNSGNHLLRLIDDIIEISRIEANELIIQEEEFSLNTLLSEIVLSFQVKMKKKTNVPIHLNTELKIGEDVITSDMLRLRQIVTNLLGNAIKFTKSGYVEVNYVIEKENISFKVVDTGIGLSDEEISIIFNYFRQANEEISQKYGGTGLGLAITKACVNLLGGTIEVESTKGKGTVFSFTIPYKPVLKSEKELAVTFKKIDGDLNKKKKILIVEDNMDNYLLLDAYLEKINPLLLHAENGLDAIDICEKDDSINLVLVDVQLPDIDGYEVTKKIKEMRPDLPIIAQTANAMKKDIIMSKKAGCDNHLSKPIDEEVLFSMVDKYMN